MDVAGVLFLIGVTSGALLAPVARSAEGGRRHPAARAAVRVASSLPAAEWAAEYAPEAAAAALVVQRAMRLCEALACDMQMVAADPTGGKTMDACDVTAGVALIKAGDSTPVTAADFAIQALVASALRSSFPADRFMGEEDAHDLRTDKDLRSLTLSLSRRFGGPSDEAGLLAAVDAGLEPPRCTGERVWVLDPIDGTKGFMTGQGYVIGLALLIDGRPVVGAMGSPNEKHAPPIMVAAKGRGLRFYNATATAPVHFSPSRPAWAQHAEPPAAPAPAVTAGAAPTAASAAASVAAAAAPAAAAPAAAPAAASAGASSALPADAPPLVETRPPPWLLSPQSAASACQPFGPDAPPDVICCGAMVKYFAVAAGQVSGFVQYEESLKTWDHACGVICVAESGGTATDADGIAVRFPGRMFEVHGGIVCTSRWARTDDRERLLGAALANVAPYDYAADQAVY